MLPLQGARGPSLVRELRATKLHGKAKEKSKLNMLIFFCFQKPFPTALITQKLLSRKNSKSSRKLGLVSRVEDSRTEVEWLALSSPKGP